MRYLIGRALLVPPTALVVMTLVFALVRLIPGDVVTLLTNDQNVTPEAADRLRRQLGLDDPPAVQFGRYLGGLLRGDAGTSIWTDISVGAEFRQRLPVTAELATLAALFSVTLGVPLGALAAVTRDRWPDHLLRAAAVAGLAVPGFWLGTLAIVAPAVWWGYSPPLRYVSPLDSPWDNLRQFVVPALLMSLSLAAVLLRLTRAVMIETLGDEYIRTARAKGLSERRVVLRHALRNALIPVVTVFGTQCAVLLGGTVIFEQVFNLKGIGSYMYQAVSRRDYPVIQSVNVFLALTVLLLNFAVDISYTLLDPRTRTRT